MIRQAQIAAEVAAEQARANQAGPRAEAQAVKALQIANAEGAKQLIAAYANMTADQQKVVIVKKVIENAPALIEAFGKAGKDIVGEYARILTAAMSSIDKITVYDTGGGGGGGKDGALERMLSTGPGSFYHLLKNAGSHRHGSRGQRTAEQGRHRHQRRGRADRGASGREARGPAQREACDEVDNRPRWSNPKAPENRAICGSLSMGEGSLI